MNKRKGGSFELQRLSAFCLTGLFTVLVTTFFLILYTYKTIHKDLIPTETMLFLIFKEFSIILVLFLFVLIFNYIIYLTSRKTQVFLYTTAVVSSVFTLFSISSYLFYDKFGIFINFDGVTFFLYQPFQIFKHAIALLPREIALISFFVLLYFVSLIKIFNSLNEKNRKKINIINQLGLVVVIIITFSTVINFSLINLSSKIIKDNHAVSYNLLQYTKKISNERPPGPYSFFFDGIINFNSADNLYTVNVRDMHLNKKISMSEYVSQQNEDKILGYDVLFILIESLRQDQISIFNDQSNGVMPNLDILAQESLIFPNTYSQATHSNYADICPLSSHYPLRSVKTHFYPKNPSYPRVLIYDILKEFGYSTAIISSQNENWGGMANYLQTEGLNTFIHADNFQGDLIKPSYGNATKNFFDWNIDTNKVGKIEDSQTIDMVIQWIDNLPEKKPYFLYTNLQNSHIPYYYPPTLQRKFLIDNDPRADAVKNGQLVGVPKKYVQQAYSDSLFYIDKQIGRLIQHLKKTGRWGKTIMVVSADTSVRFAGRMMGNAGEIIREVVQVPLLIRFPNKQHKIDERLVQHIDLPPTILGLMNFTEHPSFQGRDLFKSEEEPNKYVYLVAQTPLAMQYGILTKEWQLIYDIKSNLYLFEPFGKDLGSIGPTTIDDGKIKLQKWINMQIKYYENSFLQKTFYPPKFLN